MIKALCVLILSILLFVILYFVWGFINADINFINWSEGSRAFMVFIWSALNMPLFGAAAMDS